MLAPHARGCPSSSRGTTCGRSDRSDLASPSNATVGNWTDLTSSIPSSPPPLQFASTAYDPATQQVVLFGGFSDSACGAFGDCGATWAFSSGEWTQLHPANSPPAMRGAALTYDSEDGYLLLFGGFNDSTDAVSHETWTFSGGDWTERTAVSPNASNTPPARYVSRLADDPTDGYVVMFGGCQALGCNGLLNDTWTYLAGNWTNRTAQVGAAPSPRGGELLVWDPAESAVLLYGGAGSSVHLNDTWELKDGAWSEIVEPVSPGPRGDSWAIYDPTWG